MTQQHIEIGRFSHDGGTLIGAIQGDKVHVLSRRDDLAAQLERLPGVVGNLPPETVALSQCALLPPLDPVARVFAVAVNYVAHGKEAKAAPPPRPLIFYKAPTNFVGQDATLNANRDITAQFDYEAEVGVVIGKRCTRVSVEDALDFAVGICALNDGSARDMLTLQTPDKPWLDWLAAKGLDGASAIGPTIRWMPDLARQLADGSIELSARLNGKLVQQARMQAMIFSTARIISTLSSYMTLLPGDVIATGTPAGVGMATGNFLQQGDRLEFQVGEQQALRVTVG